MNKRICFHCNEHIHSSKVADCIVVENYIVDLDGKLIRCFGAAEADRTLQNSRGFYMTFHAECWGIIAGEKYT